MDSRRIESLWAHVQGLVVLGALGSYTAAAQRLGLSKAAMSQRIAELERAAGVPLVQRTTRSVRLTEAGQQLADASSAAFDSIAAAFAGTKDLAATPRGLLRVTAPVALARQQIVPLLPAFLRAHAEVRLELDLSDRLVPLAQEGYDLAIRHSHAPPDTHVAWALCRTQSVLVASRAYLRRHGAPAEPEDLARHACLHYLRPGEAAVWQLAPLDAPPHQHAQDGQAAAQADGAPQRVRSIPVAGPLATNNSEALREAALAGLGIALLPDFSAQRALRSGQLLRVLPAWQPGGSFADQVWAVRPYSPQVPRAVSALVAFLRQALRAGFVDQAATQQTPSAAG